MSETSAICSTCGSFLVHDSCPKCEPATIDTPLPSLPSIPGYKLLYPIGEGGMGAVYLALDETLGRQVAIKIVSEKLAETKDSRDRFLREARMMATVEHPNIVRIYAFEETGKDVCIVMEYVEGESLSDRIKRSGKLPLQDATQFLSECVEALEAAWEKGIIHRDIKAANLLIDKKNHVRVADFGLAKPINGGGDASLTGTGVLLGTPHYISPEQAQGHPVDFRSDIYSLGIVFYEMLAGERPYQGTTPVAVVAKHLHSPLPSLREKRPDVPEGVVRLLESMTQKDPANRPASYLELLQSMRDAMSPVVSTNQAPPAAPQPSARPSTVFVDILRSPRMVARGMLALIAVFVSLLFVWFSYWKHGRDPIAVLDGKQFVVAVTPFYGPDEDSAKEGRLMAALTEKAIADKLGEGAVKVIGVDQTKSPVKSQEEARALGRNLHATAVIWGEAFSLRQETEIQPYLTVIPREENGNRKGIPLGQAQESSPGRTQMEAAAPNQIELRRTSAEGIGELVVAIAGMHALYIEGNPGKALQLFDRASKTPESLRYRSEALRRLHKEPEAIAALLESLVLKNEAQTHATLADIYVEEGRQQEALQEYQAAIAAGGEFGSTRGFFLDGRLYLEEFVRSKSFTGGLSKDTSTLLAIDPASGKVLSRLRLRGPVSTFTVKNGEVEIGFSSPPDWNADPIDTSARLINGKLDRKELFCDWRPPNTEMAWAPAANFVQGLKWNFLGEDHSKFVFRKMYDDAPATEADLEKTLREGMQRDPTQPWNSFFLGQLLWSQKKSADAQQLWEALFGSEFDDVPYYEYARMAGIFEDLGHPAWADRAYARALDLRKALAQPIDVAPSWDRFQNAAFLITAAQQTRGNANLDRGYLWLQRGRELTGVEPQFDALTSWVWYGYFRRNGQAREADFEARRIAECESNPLSESTTFTKGAYFEVFFLSFLAAYSFTLVLSLYRAAKRTPRSKGAGLWGAVVSFLVVSGVGVLFSRLSLSSGQFIQWVEFYGLFCVATLALMGFRGWSLTLPEMISVLSKKERLVLASLFLATLGSYSAYAYHDLRWNELDSLGVRGISDDGGSPYMLGFAESRLKERDTKAVRFAAAVINQLAGRFQRAEELYKSIPEEKRAQRNLQSMLKGNPVPDSPLTAGDLSDAFASPSLGEVGAWMWNPWDVKVGSMIPEQQGFVAFHAFILFSGILLLSFLFTPSKSPEPNPDPLPATAGKPRKLLYLLFPGAFDLRYGSILRGGFMIYGFAFAILSCLCALTIQVLFNPYMFINQPLPTPAGLTDLNDLNLYFRHALFWHYPYAKIFFPLGILFGLASLGLHIARFRNIYKFQR